MPGDQGVRARLIRVFGFFKKELFSVFRQPRLLLTLVLGPFLILLLFGLGYREAPPPFRTLLVVGEGSETLTDRGDLSEAFGASIDLRGTIQDPDEGTRQLQNDEIDLLIIAPSNPVAAIESEEAATFQVVHGEVDPVQRSTIDLIARLAIDEINRRALESVVGTAQEESEEIAGPLTGARDTSSRLVSALEAGDDGQADAEVAQLREELGEAETEAEGNPAYDEAGFAELADLVDAVDSADDAESALEQARALESALTELDQQLSRAQGIEPGLLVSPFDVTVTQVNEVSEAPGHFYSPGTLALLVQHLALTFAALSLVRERQLGLTEVFRVSPLSSGEAMVGKYLGFGAIAVVISAILTATMIAFGIEVRGSIWVYALVMVLLILASLGLGFLLSGLARTDTQAVQYAMITLLLSIFFTGFVLPLERLAQAVHVVSYLIPATYSIKAIHDIVFRGVAVSPFILGGLTLYAIVVGVAAWWVMRRDVSSLPA